LEDNQPRPEDTGMKSSSKPTVVGIGASAGGLGALKKFFDNVPAGSGLAFVVVVHLAPGHKSHLADLLQPHARFPVQQVNETTLLEPDHAFIIPPNANISTIDTHLRLSELEGNRGHRAPIDHFFRTLANTHNENAVGVVLSGTGSDGTLGIRDIKANGGLVIVQDPNDAEYDGMPQSVIATGLADLILPVEEIPGAILRHDRTEPQVKVPGDGAEAEQSENKVLHQVFAQLRAETDRDFSHYKHSTAMRRIGRRMQLNYIEDLPAYLERLREHPAEVRKLADDLLISVTSFFRDPEAFEKLEKEIVPGLFANKGPNDTVRMWSVGCATGEEAYSIAMLLLEEAGHREAAPQIQIFGSDLHTRSLQQAREGLYLGNIEADVSAERLKRFFHKENGSYRIRKEVRDAVVFAPHNVLSDPPFSRIDLIACRNLLIYLDRDVQRAVIELFHYALNPDGVLLLGSAETIEASDLFRAEDKKLCLYRRRNVPAPEVRLPVFPLTRARLPDEPEPKTQFAHPISYGMLHQRMVERYAPPSLLVSPDNKLVHLSEHAGRYLLHPGGEPTANVFKLVREELRIELRALLQGARETTEVRDSKPIAVQFDGYARPVVMHVGPAPEAEQEGFALIIFEEREPRKPVPGEPEAAGFSENDAGQTTRIEELENQLEVSRQRLRSVIEEYETGQEEMRASNEEMQSTNEELRSTMEELETSKEELQSINEELLTLNQENRYKVEELGQLSSDLHNLLSATGIATLFLDRELRIMRFTPKVSELFNVRTADRGRPISDLTHRLGYSELQSDAEAVLHDLAPIEREVRDDAGRWYLTRVLPYRSTDDRIEGVVITFVDISRRVIAETALRQSEKRLSEELDAMQRLHGLVARLLVCPDLAAALKDVLDSAIGITGAEMGTIRVVNPSTNNLEIAASRGFEPDFFDRFGSVATDAGTAYGRALQTRQRVVIEDVLNDPRYEPFREMAAMAGYRALQATPLVSRDGRILGILSTHYAQPRVPSERDLRILDLYTRQAADFVERRRAEEELRQSEERYRLLVENAREYAIFMLDAEGRVATWNSGAECIFGYREEEILGGSGAILFTEEDRAAGVPEAEMARAADGIRSSDDRWQTRKNGSRFWASGAMELLHSPEGTLRGFVKVLRDNTERKAAEDALRAHERNLSAANEALTRVNADLKQFAIAASHDLREPLRTVSTYSELLIEATREGREQDAQMAVGVIVETNGKMGRLLDDLLMYTQLNVDEERHDQRVDLNLVVEETLANLKTIVEESGAQVTYQGLPAVRGRETYFIQLFQNLISNAIKYRKEHPPKVHISARRTGEEWRFAVADNGIGIDPRFQEQIFGVFKRLHGSEIPGTGFGLGICRRVVERSGGRIWVESKLGEGTTFCFTLPVAEGN